MGDRPKSGADHVATSPPPIPEATRGVVRGASGDGLTRRAADASGTSEIPALAMYGRYEVLGRIAFGGMAEIFLGRETTSVGASRYLVIKRILPHVADDAQFVEMFLDEARLAIQLNHPNICHIYEFGELEDSYFIAMEWVHGVPLGKLIRKARLIGGVPPEIAVKIIAEVAEALHYAHRAKDALGRPMHIVHRDVSPHNVMVAYDGQVKLLDFGIAKAATHASKTEAGVVKGKFSYMAPEQCLGKDIDGRADVFALGICLFETLSGKALYHRENEYETMRAVIHEEPPSITATDRSIPEDLDAIVQKALAKDRDVRYESAGALQHALERWLADARRVVNAAKVGELMEELYREQIRRGPLVDSTPFGQSFQRRKVSEGSGSLPAPDAPAASPPVAPRRSPLALVAVAALILAIGLGAGWALFGRGTEAPPDPPSATAPPVAATSVTAPPVTPVTAPPDPAPVVAPDPTEAPMPAAPGPRVGSLVLTSTPSGARVSIDGQRMEGSTPLTIPVLEPGLHEVELERPGYRPFRDEIEVVAGEQSSLAGTLSPAPQARESPPGRLSINTRPWSKVYVGRRLLGTTPIAEVQVPSGTVRLRLVDRDGATHDRAVRVGAGDTERVFYDLAQ